MALPRGRADVDGNFPFESQVHVVRSPFAFSVFEVGGSGVPVGSGAFKVIVVGLLWKLVGFVWLYVFFFCIKYLAPPQTRPPASIKSLYRIMTHF